MGWKGRGIHGSGKHSLTGDRHGRVWRDKLIREQKAMLEKYLIALRIIWPFIEEDFPVGTGKKHGTCCSEEYVKAARMVEQVLKGE